MGEKSTITDSVIVFAPENVKVSVKIGILLEIEHSKNMYTKVVHWG